MDLNVQTVLPSLLAIWLIMTIIITGKFSLNLI